MERRKMTSLIGLLLFALSACNTKPTDTKSGYSKSDKVEDVNFIEFLTGKNSKNYVELMEGAVGGTDLGVPFYNSKDQNMYLLFGDTFQQTETGLWRSSVMSYSKDFDLSDGLAFDGWYTHSSRGIAQAVIEGRHAENEDYTERTKIPQGGIEVNGTVYIFYESIRHWGEAGWWDVNYQGVIKSTDNCDTFERVYDLTWFADTSSQYIDIAKTLAEEDMEFNPSGVTIDVEGRHAPYFSQAYPVDGKDGYIYVFGRMAGRQHGIKVARVLKENIEIFNEYEYYTGHKNGTATWVKGSEGLAAIDNEEVGFVVSGATSNMSVMYNKYLNKWMLVYFNPKSGSASIGFRLSDTPYGEYGELNNILENDYPYFEQIMTDYSIITRDTVGFYGAFVHELYQEQDGKVFYLIISITNPVYNTLLFKVTLK